MGKVMLLITASWIANARDFAETITVRVHNVPGAPAPVIAKGEQEASFVFRWAGIDVRQEAGLRRTGRTLQLHDSYR
jgi:hypothetical protein